VSSLLTMLRARLAGPTLASLLLALSTAVPTVAHSPDPLLGGPNWAQNQVVKYMWLTGQAPPAWLATAIDDGADDSNASRNSQAATFTRSAYAASKISYGGVYAGCPSYGIACMNRSGAPDSFTMYFRPHGTVLDWGTLRWCQAMSTPTNGCYDARRVALDEFGHVENLGHHANYADESDYLDAVVQYAGRARPKEGWNTHVFGRCDVARLQLEYELIDSSDLVSTCLDLATSLEIGTSDSSIPKGASTTVTGQLEIKAATGARELSGDGLSARIVTLQRRAMGSTTWTSIGTLAPASGDGSYSITISPQATADFRLVYDSLSSEGLRDSTSPILRITVEIYVAPCQGTTTKASKDAVNQLVPCV
jgi:hypothetical protein